MPEGVIFEVSHATDPWAPVWTDHTADLLDWEVKRGRRTRLGGMETGTLVATVANSAALGMAGVASRWDPSHPTLPLGSLDEWRPVRLRWDPGDGSGILPIFYGYLDTIAPKGTTAELRAVDGFKHLAQVPVPSAWEATLRDIQLNGPGTLYEWWRLDDAAGPPVNTYGVAAAYELNVTRPQAPAVAGDPNTAVRINNGYIVLPPANLPAGSTFHAACSFRVGSDTANQVVFSMYGDGSVGSTALGLEVGVYGTGGTGAQGTLYAYFAGPTGARLAYDIGGTGRRFDDGKNHTVVVRWTPGASPVIGIDNDTSSSFNLAAGTMPTTYLYVYNGTVLGNRAGAGFPGLPIDVDEFATFSAATVSPINLANTGYGQTYWAGLKILPRQRAAGLLDLAGWPAALRDATDYDANTDWQVTGASSLSNLTPLTGPLSEGILGALQTMASGLLGEVYIDRAGVIRCIGYGTLAARTTIAATFGGAGLPFTAGDPTRSPTYGGARLVPTPSRPLTFTPPTFNGPLQVVDPTAATKYLPRILERPSDISTIGDARVITQVLLDQVKVPRTYWPKLTVPTNGLTLAQRKSLLCLDLLDRVTVNASPVAGGYTLAVDSRVAGIVHKSVGGSAGHGKWRTDIQTIPNV